MDDDLDWITGDKSPVHSPDHVGQNLGYIFARIEVTPARALATSERHASRVLSVALGKFRKTL